MRRYSHSASTRVSRAARCSPWLAQSRIKSAAREAEVVAMRPKMREGSLAVGVPRLFQPCSVSLFVQTGGVRPVGQPECLHWFTRQVPVHLLEGVDEGAQDLGSTLADSETGLCQHAFPGFELGLVGPRPYSPQQHVALGERFLVLLQQRRISRISSG